VERIAAAAVEVAAGGPILEVGAGLGALTVALAAHGNPIVAFEVDPRLEAPLAELLTPFDKVTLRLADFLEADLAAEAGGQPFVVAGNLPYQITTPLLERGGAAAAGWSRRQDLRPADALLPVLCGGGGDGLRAIAR